MKTILPSFLISFLLTFSAHADFTSDGTTVANGGDVVAASFGKVARKALYGYNENYFRGEDRIILNKLKEVLMVARVHSVEHLQLDSREVNSMHVVEQNLIVVNRSTWGDLKSSLKIHTAIHEYLMIAGYDDNDYTLSARIQRIGETPVVFPLVQ
jgi:hypothetical protein